MRLMISFFKSLILFAFISNYSYSIVINGLKNNPKHNLPEEHAIFKKSEDIIQESIGILDNNNIARKDKIVTFQRNMSKNADFEYLSKLTFLKSSNFKLKSYFKRYQNVFQKYYTHFFQVCLYKK